jgi:hypothetical protein
MSFVQIIALFPKLENLKSTRAIFLNSKLFRFLPGPPHKNRSPGSSPVGYEDKQIDLMRTLKIQTSALEPTGV